MKQAYNTFPLTGIIKIMQVNCLLICRQAGRQTHYTFNNKQF